MSRRRPVARRFWIYRRIRAGRPRPGSGTGLVAPLLLRDFQVGGNANHDDSVLESRALWVRHEVGIFVLVRMREDRFVRVDQREAAGLDVLFLAEREQAVKELLVDLQHLDELP